MSLIIGGQQVDPSLLVQHLQQRLPREQASSTLYVSECSPRPQSNRFVLSVHHLPQSGGCPFELTLYLAELLHVPATTCTLDARWALIYTAGPTGQIPALLSRDVYQAIWGNQGAYAAYWM